MPAPRTGAPGHDQRFDVIIVGARCAGAALAIHLARAGKEVLVVDSAPLPGGPVASTHLIQPPGMDELDALGLGDQVRDLAPALTTVRMFFDEYSTEFSYGPGRAAHCLRRSGLDSRLQFAAGEAGATLIPRTRVVGVVRNPAGGVCGVDLRAEPGGRSRVLAPLVVGADGRHSSIAKLVGAEEYLGYEAPRACYWAYWQRPPSCDAHVIYNCFEGENARIVFPTDGELFVIATAPPVQRVGAWRDDHTTAYLADISSYAPIAELLDTDVPVSEVRGVVRNRYFFRASSGQGWALIGDAGHHKDFGIGLGISDALRDARALASAIVSGDPTAAERYWRQRDVERMELFHWSRDLGAPDRVNALERLVGKRAGAAADVTARLGAVIDGQLSPYQLVPPSLAMRWAAVELGKGRVGPLREVLRTGARLLRSRREVSRRRRLLRSVPVASPPAAVLPATVATQPALDARRAPRTHGNKGASATK